MTSASTWVMGSLLDYALRYLERGMSIIAVCGTLTHKHYDTSTRQMVRCNDPGKVPLVAWKKYQTDLPTEDEVREWWRRNPDANIAMLTGHLSRVVVLDLDGDIAIRAAQMLGFPNGPHSYTGRVGGMHRFFAYRDDEPRNFAQKQHGIDYRGEGGYVVLPPSRHILGRSYVWGEELADLDDLPELPWWVNDLARTPSATTSSGARGSGPITEPGRNDALTRIGGAMRYQGADEAEILEALRQVNAERCVPPLDDGEIRKIAHSVARYAPEDEDAPRVRVNGVVADEEEADVGAMLGAVPDFPIDVLPDVLQRLLKSSSLPSQLLVGAYLGAIGAAIGGNVQVYHDSFNERVILFVVLVAMTGSGKSPALREAWRAIERWDAERFDVYRKEMELWSNRTNEQKKLDKENGVLPPRDPTILLKLVTPEAIYRRLGQQPALGLVYDEIASFLKGLSRYHKHGDEDTDMALTMWEGSALRYTRVGQGLGGGNAVDIFVPQPTVTVCGGLQPYRQELLGKDLEGLRPRWLVFLFEGKPTPTISLPDAADVHQYEQAITRLLMQRTKPRRWLIDGPAWRLLNDLGEGWLARSSMDGITPSVLAALPKAIRHAARIAVLLGEFDRIERDWNSPDADQTLHTGLIGRAARIVDYTLDTWQALMDGVPLAVVSRTERIDGAINKVLEYLARRGGGPINANDLRNNHVAGISTRAELDMVLARYEARFPGTIVEVRSGPTAGRKRREIRSPNRASSRPGARP